VGGCLCVPPRAVVRLRGSCCRSHLQLSHNCHYLFPIPHWRCNKRNIDSVLFTSSSFKELEELLFFETQLYLAVT